MADFLLDTNTLWLKGGNSFQYDVEDFWNDYVENDEHDIYLPTEVIRELQVQYYKMDYLNKSALRQKIEEDLIPDLDVVDIPNSVQAEHAIRMASSYVCHTYEIIKEQTQFRITEGKPAQRWEKEYPGVSDARIILTALYHEYIPVTYNLKDFMLVLVMGKQLFNPVDNKFYDPIDPSILAKIHTDHVFQDFMYEIHKFKDIPLEPLPNELQDEEDQM